MNRTRAFTVWQLLAVLAVIALIALILLKACGGSGVLTKANGQAAGDDVFRHITDYVAGTGPIREFSGQIDTEVGQAIIALKGREGASDFADGLCERVLELINNRIRSTPDANEKARLGEMKKLVEDSCKKAHAQLSAPPPK